MKRAQLYLHSALHTLEYLSENVLSALADQELTELPIGDPEQRRLDMQAAVGTWAERSDLPDSGTYIAMLRDESREHRLGQA